MWVNGLQKGQKIRVIVFSKNNVWQPKRWGFVDNIQLFKNFLGYKFPDWVYFNCYNISSGLYLFRIYNEKNPLNRL